MSDPERPNLKPVDGTNADQLTSPALQVAGEASEVAQSFKDIREPVDALSGRVANPRLLSPEDHATTVFNLMSAEAGERPEAFRPKSHKRRTRYAEARLLSPEDHATVVGGLIDIQLGKKTEDSTIKRDWSDTQAQHEAKQAQHEAEQRQEALKTLNGRLEAHKRAAEGQRYLDRVKENTASHRQLRKDREVAKEKALEEAELYNEQRNAARDQATEAARLHERARKSAERSMVRERQALRKQAAERARFIYGERGMNGLYKKEADEYIAGQVGDEYSKESIAKVVNYMYPPLPEDAVDRDVEANYPSLPEDAVERAVNEQYPIPASEIAIITPGARREKVTAESDIKAPADNEVPVDEAPADNEVPVDEAPADNEAPTEVKDEDDKPYLNPRRPFDWAEGDGFWKRRMGPHGENTGLQYEDGESEHEPVTLFDIDKAQWAGFGNQEDHPLSDPEQEGREEAPKRLRDRLRSAGSAFKNIRDVALLRAKNNLNDLHEYFTDEEKGKRRKIAVGIVGTLALAGAGYATYRFGYSPSGSGSHHEVADHITKTSSGRGGSHPGHMGSGSKVSKPTVGQSHHETTPPITKHHELNPKEDSWLYAHQEDPGHEVQAMNGAIHHFNQLHGTHFGLKLVDGTTEIVDGHTIISPDQMEELNKFIT